MNIRESYEQWEDKYLSTFGVRSFNTKGRALKEEPCPIRTEFQRDRDRIIHSKAFRRLKHKTQVFISPEGDHYRTRLTHTLEVSQISRTIARALRLNEDLTEAIAMGHDLGHTPFGHAGEDIINELYPKGFKHNEQSLRIVEKLEEGKGLNLTLEVRDGILNHRGDGVPFTLEGQIVKIADRVAYINHDIDDAIRGGILKEKDLPKGPLKILGYGKRQRINCMVTDLIYNNMGKPFIAFSEGIGNAVDTLRNFMFEFVYIGSAAKLQEKKAKNLLKELYLYFNENPEEMPYEFYKNISEEGVERIVCDYIAGMTDRYAILVYKDKFLPQAWSK